MPRRKKTFAETHPDLDKLRVDFLNMGALGSKEAPMVFLTQYDAKGKERTLVFHVDIAIKTFRELSKKLRLYKKTKLLMAFNDVPEVDRFTGEAYR
jgi:hypothetical protein